MLVGNLLHQCLSNVEEREENIKQLELCPYQWIQELREPTKLVLLTLHLYAFTQATLC